LFTQYRKSCEKKKMKAERFIKEDKKIRGVGGSTGERYSGEVLRAWLQPSK
jgi:hypothetical protein